MKKIFRIVLALALIGSLAACNRKETYKGLTPYVTYNSSANLTVREDAGYLTVPVRVVNKSGEAFNVTVTGIDGTAVQETNYNIVDPNTGVLSFDGADTVKYITIGVKNIEGYTGDKSFGLQLTSATNGVDIAAFDSLAIKITDADHPLSDILGAYTVNCTIYNSGLVATTYTATLSAVDGDVTKVSCDAICPMGLEISGCDVIGQVSDDHKTITYSVGQSLGRTFGYGTVYLYGCHYNGGYYLDEDDIVFTATSDGFETKSGIAFVDSYVWPSYGGFVLGEQDGVTNVWTKQ